MSTHRIMDKCHRRRPRREVRPAREGDENLGVLKLLPGKWKSQDTGWNMIALPTEGPKFSYRLLMNQYSETLEFLEVDDNIPNRGVLRNDPNKQEEDKDPDQFLIGLDYKQVITQVAAEDRMIAIQEDGSEDIVASGLQGDVPSTIHHEPGLFLHMKDERSNNVDIARLATIPHGDSVLALGTSKVIEDPEALKKFRIPGINGLPIGVNPELPPLPSELPTRQKLGYMTPYSHYVEKPFRGTVPDTVSGFPGFNPKDPHDLLNVANRNLEFKRITRLMFDTEIESGGIVNIPFVVKQANAASMKSTFWIQELEGKLRMQYLQVVMLDFFPRFDGLPGLIRWPHISINTLEKVSR
ncbi:heme-binding protein [Ketobacter sp.]|uniref:heme-binding protein n=1 Tax=Ketobacter sp. TaxID=2083498 RepID=UPI0025BB2ADE|nr:heme-binding protein [Ketobacter sp.]